jgi:hypothetical protein
MTSENVVIDYAAVLADLKAKRADLDVAIAGIERMVGLATAAQGAASIDVTQHGSDVEPDSFFGMSIADAAKKFLAMKKKPQTTADIAEALEKGGMTHTSGNWGNTVGSVLNRIDGSTGEIVRVKRGTWGLASWYPGRKRPEKPKDEGGPQDDGKAGENS